MLKDIITSEARLKVLKYFYGGGEGFAPYVREVTRGTDLEINAVRRELNRLSGAGLLQEDPRGNRLHYKLNPQHDLYYDLAAIMAREVGLGRLLIKKKKQIGTVSFSLLSLNFFLKKDVKNPLDLIVVGNVYLKFLKDLISNYQDKEDAEVNYMVVSKEEYKILKDRKDPLLISILSQPRSIIIGSQGSYLTI